MSGAACSSRRSAGKPEPAVGQPEGEELRRLEFIRDAAEQLGDDVLERNQADDGAGVVFDQRLMAAPLAEECQQPIGGHRCRDPDDRPQQRGERDAARLEVVG